MEYVITKTWGRPLHGPKGIYLPPSYPRCFSFMNLYRKDPSYKGLDKVAHPHLAGKKSKIWNNRQVCVVSPSPHTCNKGNPDPYPFTSRTKAYISKIPKLMFPFPHHFFRILPFILVRGRIILIKALCPLALIFELGHNRSPLPPFIHSFPVYPLEEFVGFNCADAAGDISQTM